MTEALAGLKLNQLYRVASEEAAIKHDFAKYPSAQELCYVQFEGDEKVRVSVTRTTLFGIWNVRRSLYDDLKGLGYAREARLLIYEARRPYRNARVAV